MSVQSLPPKSSITQQNPSLETGEEYEVPDDMYKKIVSQIDDEDRLWCLFTELKEFTENAIVPLLESLTMENLSTFLNPPKVF